jgi:hypothetical protein
MKPIIINTLDFSYIYGGIQVLHKLCHDLNAHGYPAYVCSLNIDKFNLILNPAYNTPIATQYLFDNINDCIVLYPEIAYGNELNCDNVIRWILSPPLESRYNTWKESDTLYWYLDLYKIEYQKDLDNNLTSTIWNDSIFIDKKLERTNELCWTWRKAQEFFNRNEQYIPPTATEIYWDDIGNYEALAHIFNTHKKFVSFHPFTFLNVQAAMCGCDSYVVPVAKYTKTEWLSRGLKIGTCCTQYGEDDANRVANEKHLLPFYIQEQKNIEQSQLESFIEKLKTK